jgi:hypothetical protein
MGEKIQTVKFQHDVETQNLWWGRSRGFAVRAAQQPVKLRIGCEVRLKVSAKSPTAKE